VKEITSQISIVMTSSGDAVRQGLVASLARPGGNVTEMTTITPELTPKRLEVLKEALAGRLARVAFLWCPDDAVNEQSWREMQAAAQTLGMRVQSLEVLREAEVPARIGVAVDHQAQALVVSDCPHRLSPKLVAELATRRGLPTMFPFKWHVTAGGLMAYAPDIGEQIRRAADYVDSNSSRRNTGRSARGAAHEVRAGDQPCVQRKLTCSAGVSPAGVRARAP
jgi:ABC-type uncharacterized transport system substrate-binding protein